MDRSVLAACRVLPVVTAHSVEQTVTLSRTLFAGGMKAVEITLRTEPALASIAAVKAQVPGLLVAAGTVTNPDDLHAAVGAGADFCVSPGLTENLLRAASQEGVDFVPGVSTASEVMQGMDYGYDCFKLFPAVAVGGINLLKSLSGPYPNIQFCPTGGLNVDNFRTFLALPNVVCCGGSWMVSSALVDAGNWSEIERLAREAMAQ
jgi:2-dehydro-3-deoxyphosphogluconate aldolase/(4S)-4-hydroxy-2-oxoglutarate aldolase